VPLGIVKQLVSLQFLHRVCPIAIESASNPQRVVSPSSIEVEVCEIRLNESQA
jgi:hypothetical protein